MSELQTPVTEVCAEIEKILHKDFGKTLYFPNRQNAARLLKLKVWSIRYSVSIRYILSKLVPYFEHIASRHYLRKDSKGLGVSIPVLTGKAAEEKLKEFIAKEFHDSENVLDWKESERERCIRLMEKEEVMGRPRPILQYRNVNDFVDAYSSKIDIKRKEADRLAKKMAKQPWRGNPWR